MAKDLTRPNTIMDSLTQETSLQQKSLYLRNKYRDYFTWDNLDTVSLLTDAESIQCINELSPDSLKIQPEQMETVKKIADKFSHLHTAHQEFVELAKKKKEKNLTEDEEKKLDMYRTTHKPDELKLAKPHLFDVIAKFQSPDDKSILNYLLNLSVILNDRSLSKKIEDWKKLPIEQQVKQPIVRNETESTKIIVSKKNIREDFTKYLEYQEAMQIASQENISQKKLISRTTSGKIKSILDAKKTSGSSYELDLEGFEDDELTPALIEKKKKIIQETKHPLYQETAEMADKITFLDKIIKTFRKTNYVLSLEDQARVEEIVSYLNKNDIVFLSGETGSGKTELGILVAEMLADKKLEKNNNLDNNYVIVGGAKATDLEDFTLEKVVTSRKITGSGKDDLVTSKKTDLTKQICDGFFQRKELQADILASVKEEEQDSMKQYLDTIDPQEYNLFTEYHIKGLFKAMYYGVPLIIDEMNAVRPEVLIGLNHFFTRKVGQEVSLPNGLGNIKVKSGFCIICTGNDAYQHAGTRERYTQGRYVLDEATMNRLTSIAKNYHKQIDELFVDTDSGDTIPAYIRYLKQNEMYGVLLALLFADPKNKNKLGFELMKYNFVEDGKSDTEHKKEIFESMKKFAIAINKIQSAFSGEHITLTKGKTIDLGVIKRKVISMRNIRKILDDYKSSPYSLEYHIYKNYIRSTTNEAEKYALLRVFNDFGFFEGLVLDNQEVTLAKVETGMEKESKKGGKITAMEFGKEKFSITPQLIAHKLIMSKEDLYEPYFGEAHMIDDSKFNDERIQADMKKIEEKEAENADGKIEKKIEISKEMIQELSGVIYEYLNNEVIATNLSDIAGFSEIYIFEEKIKGLNNNSVTYEDKNIEVLYNILTQISDMFERMIGDEMIDEDSLKGLVSQFNKI